MMLFQSSRPQLGKEYQEILDDFLSNIEFNMMNSRKRSGQGDGLNDGPDYEEETLESDT